MEEVRAELAGMDKGCSLTKFYWVANGISRYASTADRSVSDILGDLRQCGITEISSTGIGRCPALPQGMIHTPAGRSIDDELIIQARGMRRLCDISGVGADELICVSVGSGTSYTVLRGDKVLPMKPGNALGGATISGLAHCFGFSDFDQVNRLAALGKSLDLLVKDQLPETDGSPLGEFVVAHFAKALETERPSMPDILTTVINVVAISVVRDLILFEAIVEGALPSTVVYGGTAVARLGTLWQRLEQYTRFVGKTPYRVGRAEYAGAVGAYYATP